MSSIRYTNSPQFKPKDKVISLVYHHPPEIMPGTEAEIVLPILGSLYAVQLPDGELHRWFAWFELEPIYPKLSNWKILCPGEFAKITNTTGHPPHIYEGMLVRIVKVFTQTPFYDVLLNGKDYHRWLAEFEITEPVPT